MATKKENAKKIQDVLGIEINPEANDPKADVLEAWATGLESDQEGTEKAILTWKLEALTGVELATTTTTEQIKTWLERAETDKEGAVQAITAASTSTPATPPSTASEAQAPASSQKKSVQASTDTIKVSLSPAVARYGGTFSDPEQDEGKRVIGAQSVTVKRTALISEGLRNGTLVEG